MGGSSNSLVVRNYSGGLGLSNYTGGGAVSVDMGSGRVVVASTVTAGSMTIRGIAEVEDNSTGTAVVTDATINEQIDLMLTVVNAINGVVAFVRKLLGNKAVVASGGATSTIYDDDKTTPILVFDHPDANTRDPQ